MCYSDLLSLFGGAITTVLLSLAGIAFGQPIGFGMALLRWGRVPVLGPLTAALVSFLRASPLVTLLLLIFYGLPSIGFEIGPTSAAVLALALNTSAFNCEIWRSGLNAFPVDQLEAAKSVGMSSRLRMQRIVFPQLIRTCLPGIVNELSQLIKVTPVLAIVGIVDVTRAAVRIGANTYAPLPPLCIALLIYIPIIYGLVSIQRWAERSHARREAVA